MSERTGVLGNGHFRVECEHGVPIRQCRCAVVGSKRVEVARPCPLPTEHLGMTVVHPLPPAEAIGDGLGQVPAQPAEPVQGGLGDAEGGPGPETGSGSGVRAFRRCVFRSCDYTLAEPADLLGLAALDAEIRVHLRTHRAEIELLARFIQ